MFRTFTGLQDNVLLQGLIKGIALYSFSSIGKSSPAKLCLMMETGHCFLPVMTSNLLNGILEWKPEGKGAKEGHTQGLTSSLLFVPFKVYAGLKSLISHFIMNTDTEGKIICIITHFSLQSGNKNIKT